MNVVTWGGRQAEPCRHLGDVLGRHFVGRFHEFAPQRVQLVLGNGTHARFEVHAVWVQAHSFVGLVVLHVRGSLFRCGHVGRPARRVFFGFLELQHVRAKQLAGSLRVMIRFPDAPDSISFPQCQLYFFADPRTTQVALFRGMRTELLRLRFGTRTAQRKRQLVPTSIRQHGMVQPMGGCFHVTLDEPVNVTDYQRKFPLGRFCVAANDRMTHGIRIRIVDVPAPLNRIRTFLRADAIESDTSSPNRIPNYFCMLTPLKLTKPPKSNPAWCLQLTSLT